jgi:hypothetical protein
MIADLETMLWDQILLDSWQEVFDDRDVMKLSYEETKMDDLTIDFIDGVGGPCCQGWIRLMISYWRKNRIIDSRNHV